MNGDLISRSAVCAKCGAKEDGELFSCSDECLIFPGNVPAVDAVEVVHGRWIPADGKGETCDEWDCSICERRLTFGEEMEANEVYELNHYCPNCGAKMDEERKDNG